MKKKKIKVPVDGDEGYGATKLEEEDELCMSGIS